MLTNTASQIAVARFQDAVESWSSPEIQDTLESLQGKRTAWAKARAEVLREELAARMAFGDLH
ncbi:hypothetical protein [Thiomonas sp.]